LALLHTLLLVRGASSTTEDEEIEMKSLRRKPPPSPAFHFSGTCVYARDPIDGCSHSWPARDAGLLIKYWHAAVKLNLTIAELWHMTVAADPFHDL
jgi:hypothetical protein